CPTVAVPSVSPAPASYAPPGAAVGGFGLVEDHPEALVGLLGVEPLHPEPLGPRRLAGGELDVGLGDGQRLGQEAAGGLVGPTLHRRGGHPDLEGVAVAADPGAPTGAGLHVDPEDDAVRARVGEVARV